MWPQTHNKQFTVYTVRDTAVPKTSRVRETRLDFLDVGNIASCAEIRPTCTPNIFIVLYGP